MLTNREIGKIIGTTEQVIKNHLRGPFDKLGVWSRLELAMYVASHGGKGRLEDSDRPGSLNRAAASGCWLAAAFAFNQGRTQGDN